MAWLNVVLAGIVEIFWVIGLRYSQNLWQWTATIIMIILSFYLIIKACERLPSGTVYATFTGIGASSIVLIDFVVFNADFSWVKVLLIGLIIFGVVGLKLTTVEKEFDSKPAVNRAEENK
ncbi:MAG TPA: multidrug efflux SMR transporter [Syntrophomonadaceae bacterium]|nr:multidrug efflux SMR transporter [Syntrophomonadaceae bacterium]